jgi:hypothetical protein
MATGFSANDGIVNLVNLSENYTISANGIIGSLSFAPFEYKLFVLQNSAPALNLAILGISPKYNEIVDNSTTTVQIIFSEPVSPSSLTGNKVKKIT